MTVTPGSEAATHPCPWCATPVAIDAARCPACGAALIEQPAQTAAIPGVTQAGELGTSALEEVVDAGRADSVALPSDAVRREMLRLELEALEAELRPASTAAEPAAAEPAAAEPAEAPANDAAAPTVTPADAPAGEPRPTPDATSGGSSSS